VTVLSLAATPSFAVLAWLTNASTAPDMFCGGSPFASMALMYGLMAVFHLPPWLRLIGRGIKPA